MKWYLLGPLTAAVSLPALMYLCAVLLAREILPFSLVEELAIACVFLSGTLSALAACAGRGGRAAQTGLAMERRARRRNRGHNARRAGRGRAQRAHCSAAPSRR